MCRWVIVSSPRATGWIPRGSCFAGWACRMRTMFPDGRRQIFEFVLPGGDVRALPAPAGDVALSTMVMLDAGHDLRR